MVDSSFFTSHFLISEIYVFVQTLITSANYDVTGQNVHNSHSNCRMKCITVVLTLSAERVNRNI